MVASGPASPGAGPDCDAGPSHAPADPALGSSSGLLDRLPPDLLSRHVLVCRASLQHLTSSDRKLHHRFPRPSSLLLRLAPPPPREGAGGRGGGGGGGPPGEGGGDGWYGSQGVLSYFVSELGTAPSVRSVSLQGWQELSGRDVHHLTAAYPRLRRLHLGGMEGSNYLLGSSLDALGSAPAQGRCLWLQEVVVDAQVVLDTSAALLALSQLPALTRLELSALPLQPSLDLPLARLAACPRLSRLGLVFEARPAAVEALLGGRGALGALTQLRSLALDFMQLGTGSSQWNAGWLLRRVAARMPYLEALHLPRGFLYDKSDPDLLAVLANLPHLTDLALGSLILGPDTAAAAAAGFPRAPLGAASSPPSTPRHAAPTDSAGPSTPGPSTAGPSASQPSAPGPSCPGPGPSCSAATDAAEARAQAREPEPEPSTPPGAVPAPGSAPAGPRVFLARPWRRLALGAVMPCYLELLLPLLGSGLRAEQAGQPGPPGQPGPGSLGQQQRLGMGMGAGAGAGMAEPPVSPLARFSLASPGGAGGAAGAAGPRAEGRGGGGSGSGRGQGEGGAAGQAGEACGVRLLELCSPSSVPLLELLPRLGTQAHAGPGSGPGSGPGPGPGAGLLCSPGLQSSAGPSTAHDPAACSSDWEARPGGLKGTAGEAAAAGAGSGGGGAGPPELRLVVRLASTWREVVGGLAALGPGLTRLALLPTYLYGSATMMPGEVVAAVTRALPGLAHLELHRLGLEPGELGCLGGMRRLRYLLLSVAQEALDRRGRAHAGALARAALEALHEAHSGAAAVAGGAGRTSADAAAGGERGPGGEGAEGVDELAGTPSRLHPHDSTAARADVVVCCPELGVEEARGLDESAELQYGSYDGAGSRLRVERLPYDSLTRVLALRADVANVRRICCQHPSTLLVPLLVLGLVLGFGLWGVLHFNNVEVSSAKDRAAAFALDVAVWYREQVTWAIAPVTLLSAMVAYNPDYAAASSLFKGLAPTIMAQTPSNVTKQIEYVPFGVVLDIEPSAGNEKAYGLDLFALDTDKDGAVETVRTRRLTLVGPLPFFEGGYGVIVRHPIFVPGVAANETFGIPNPLNPYLDLHCGGCSYNATSRTKFWGFAAALISLDAIAEAHNPQLQSLAAAGYRYEIRTLGTDTDPPVLIGSSASPPSDPVSSTISLPGQEWVVRVAPARGWSPPLNRGLLAGVVLLGVALALLAFALLVSRRKHQMLLEALLPKDVIQDLQQHTAPLEGPKIMEAETTANLLLAMLGQLLEGRLPDVRDVVFVRQAILRSTDIYQPHDLQMHFRNANLDHDVARNLMQQLGATMRASLFGDLSRHGLGGGMGVGGEGLEAGGCEDDLPLDGGYECGTEAGSEAEAEEDGDWTPQGLHGWASGEGAIPGQAPGVGGVAVPRSWARGRKDWSTLFGALTYILTPAPAGAPGYPGGAHSARFDSDPYRRSGTGGLYPGGDPLAHPGGGGRRMLGPVSGAYATLDVSMYGGGPFTSGTATITGLGTCGGGVTTGGAGGGGPGGGGGGTAGQIVSGCNIVSGASVILTGHAIIEETSGGSGVLGGSGSNPNIGSGGVPPASADGVSGLAAAASQRPSSQSPFFTRAMSFFRDSATPTASAVPLGGAASTGGVPRTMSMEHYLQGRQQQLAAAAASAALPPPPLGAGAPGLQGPARRVSMNLPTRSSGSGYFNRSRFNTIAPEPAPTPMGSAASATLQLTKPRPISAHTDDGGGGLAAAAAVAAAGTSLPSGEFETLPSSPPRQQFRAPAAGGATSRLSIFSGRGDPPRSVSFPAAAAAAAAEGPGGADGGDRTSHALHRTASRDDIALAALMAPLRRPPRKAASSLNARPPPAALLLRAGAAEAEAARAAAAAAAAAAVQAGAGPHSPAPGSAPVPAPRKRASSLGAAAFSSVLTLAGIVRERDTRDSGAGTQPAATATAVSAAAAAAYVAGGGRSGAGVTLEPLEPAAAGQYGAASTASTAHLGAIPLSGGAPLAVGPLGSRRRAGAGERRARIDFVVERVLALADSWQYDTWRLRDVTDGHPLSALGFYLIQRAGLLQRLKIKPGALARLLRHIEAGYQDNPYHNATHAADVLQTLHVLLYGTQLNQHYVDPLGLFAAYFAAIVHDYNHPGLTNDFLIASGDPLAIRYNDRSPLENHHVAAVFGAMRRPGLDALAHLPKADRAAFRKQVIEMVLATDMKQHFALLSQFSTVHRLAGYVHGGAAATAKGSPGGKLAGSGPNSHSVELREVVILDVGAGAAPAPAASPGSELLDRAPRPADEVERLLSLQLLLKAADLGHLGEDLDVHQRWLAQLEEEFFRQGDREKALGLPISPLFDRAKQGVSKSQVGFYDFVALPLLHALSTAFPGADPLMRCFLANYNHWRSVDGQPPLELTAPDAPTVATSPGAGSGGGSSLMPAAARAALATEAAPDAGP
ncbi:hypothetical protein HYH03_000452 [Edaphochlamys debaryana]|uniref:Phosphodiesterase n=1 Tax=Edaphochlamys debaryana TaxID=47281 RepID=A0A836C7F1_9CHLO|nr:hypothetical protein HYH03_000452 [Edaphochlamys debaryana]|eukprot:KAG2501954.1 hypothetical protein HYH03_000452 [Edaphochlamys debaryana]